ncbi:hypothetical protein D2962_08110 [Biomaibacter acetigenes]|uniref:Uncharacterized protein n=1 Tax=Biomaibacter acetigenes TaxID=2316383 RepID=A0A3G2R6W9_9FIRM|nr:hypothetical protein [Biomaibacter acetigenes]AYO30587.1 hypothetical protein D2962_08110 [Biomaibacter acetigenes]
MIMVEGVQVAPIALIWETGLKEIGGLTLYWDGEAKIKFKEGDKISVAFGIPGNLQKVTNYTVWRPRQGERIEVFALEFGREWQAKKQAIYPGPRQAAIARLLNKNGEKAGNIVVSGGDRTYAQNESDIAFLYRLAGNIPVWRDSEGNINIAAQSDVKINQIIKATPASTVGRKYMAAGFTPDGKAFEVSVGDGVETRVAEVFHSPAEARDYLQRLAAAESKGRLICIGQPGIRAGCNVILPDGSKYRVTKCVHEVRHEAWTVTAYLN